MAKNNNIYDYFAELIDTIEEKADLHGIKPVEIPTIISTYFSPDIEQCIYNFGKNPTIFDSGDLERVINGEAFNNNIKVVNLPNCSYIGSAAFHGCKYLSQISLPVCESVDYYAFGECGSLFQVSLPVCSYIGYGAFAYCSSLSQISLPNCSYIAQEAFIGCSSLSKITVGVNTTFCELADINAFNNTGITATTGSIYVPANLISQYRQAQNWYYFSNRIFAIN